MWVIDNFLYWKGKDKKIVDVIRVTISCINECNTLSESLALINNLNAILRENKYELRKQPEPFNAYLSKALGFYKKKHLQHLSAKDLAQQGEKVIALMRAMKVTPDAVSCINLLTVYNATKQFKAAERLILGNEHGRSYISKWKVAVNIKLYNAFLGVCAQTQQFKAAQKVLTILKDNVRAMRPKKQIKPTNITCIELLTVYGATNEFKAAERLVLGNEHGRSYISKWKVAVNIKVFNAFLGVCAKTQEFEAAQKVLTILKDNARARRPKDEIWPDAITCIELLNVYAATKQFKAAERLVLGNEHGRSYISEWEVAVNIKVYGAFLGVCAETQEFKAAQKVLTILKDNARARCPKDEIWPDDITCVDLLTVYAATKHFKAAERLVLGNEYGRSYISEWEVAVNIKVYNAFLGVCAETQQFKAAQKVLTILRGNASTTASKDQIKPNAITCTNLLTVYAATKQFKAAERLVLGNEHEQSYISKWKGAVNIKVYGAFLNVCAQTEQFEAAQQVLTILKDNFKAMWPKYEIKPNAITCIGLLTVYAATKQFEAAERLVMGERSYMSEWKVDVNIKVYGAFLGVCAQTEQFEAAQKVLTILNDNARAMELKDEIKPDAITCIDLLTVYAATKQFEAAERLVMGERSYMSEWKVAVNIKVYNAFLGVCAQTEQFKAAQKVLTILKDNLRAIQPKDQIKPNVITCVALLIVYAATNQSEAAERLVFGNEQEQSYLLEWEIAPHFLIYAYWALVSENDFDKSMDKLCRLDLCHKQLGLVGSVFNCHVDSIFSCSLSKDISSGVPFQFAKALYQFHCRRNGKLAIEKIITGHNLGQTLKTSFISFLKEEHQLEFKPCASNTGIIKLKAQ
ncbi:hypothetical protein D5R81_15890 [Parashewanella spongiae]|uniref:Tetratricopeptide repeat protein n=1 Tax=Parashewanella spongiae TaxID=342950 RepID=A0A3A6TC82_9GAMM|nr:hypothetical protein [Parashewanella spongiae]MCL1079525.1 hypothetical protein [Parashewanella spongiae]RJY07403.1 hypothetical protein D5R81_15890 [Parashewanella spongiae]